MNSIWSVCRIMKLSLWRWLSTHWKTSAPRETRQTGSAWSTQCSRLPILPRKPWVSRISCSDTHTCVDIHKKIMHQHTHTTKHIHTEHAHTAEVIVCFVAPLYRWCWFEMRWNDGYTAPLCVATLFSPFWPFGPGQPLCPGDPCKTGKQKKSEETEKGLKWTKRKEWMKMIRSFLQGLHLLLGDLGLLNPPPDQILRSYQHRHGHQQGQVAPVESSQWCIHISHDHLNVHTIHPKISNIVCYLVH